MSRLPRLLFACSLCLLPVFAHAYADLPAHPQVDRALDEHLNVRNARARLQIGQSEQRLRDSGEYEFTLQGGLYRDQVAESGEQTNTRDWEVSIERPLRLPSKARIDSQIGEAAVARGQSALGDARHETARLLLQLWFSWQREQVQAAQWQEQLQLLQQQARITEKRIKAGEAPPMELKQVQASAATSAVALQQARLRAELAADELKRQFGAIRLPQSVAQVEPQPITRPIDYWRDKILDHNHELALAAAETEYQNRLAARARAERLPDPTLGLRYSSELNNQQKIGGVYFSIPLGYSARSAKAEAAAANAGIASNHRLVLDAGLESNIFNAYTRAVSSFGIWQQARDAAEALKQYAALMARAYALGESTLDATLLARRQALEAALAEDMARLDANESRYRLMLDAEELWHSDDDGHAPH
ncbi:MAG: TolC family protein [Gallionella sp.]|nr:TolC family protein [Gallionella sp.]NCP80053.1 TolC family protein [Gallionella sp.]NCS74857.1 TolC family protein [Gallionella sp.]PJC05365.1 MAG: transporter [Gallionellaceae bacterium CG_4_9_14_0_8_um_filter_60_335]